MGKLKTHKQFIMEMKLNNPMVNIKGKYVNSTTKILCCCQKCDFEWYAAPRHLLAGHGCPKCRRKEGHKKQTKTQEKYEQEVSNLHKNIIVIDKYINSNTAILHKCLIDGYEWLAQPSNILVGKGCPKCAGNVKKTHDDFLREMQNIHPKINVIGKYINIATKIDCECKICGHTWSAVANSLLQGHGCPGCISGRKTSFAEQAIYFYCNKVVDTYNRYNKFNKEIDVWLPELNIGIEYNGSHWHNNSEKDLLKTNYFESKGIRIITVMDGDENIVKGDIIIHTKNSLDWAITEIFKLVQLPCVDINTKRDAQEIYQQYITCKKANSFAAKYPDKAKEWDYKRNGNITPEMVDSCSGKAFWRICPSCQVSYLCPISSWRTSTVCLICNYKNVSLQQKNKGIKIYQKDRETNAIIKEWISINEAGRSLKISPIHISECLRGKRQRTGSFTWEYANTKTLNT